jgi:hypothetical protein
VSCPTSRPREGQDRSPEDHAEHAVRRRVDGLARRISSTAWLRDRSGTLRWGSRARPTAGMRTVLVSATTLHRPEHGNNLLARDEVVARSERLASLLDHLATVRLRRAPFKFKGYPFPPEIIVYGV